MRTVGSRVLSVTSVRRDLPQERDWLSTGSPAILIRATLAQSVTRLLCVNSASEVTRGKFTL